MRKLIASGWPLVLLALLAACAAPTRVAQMTVSGEKAARVSETHPLRGAVAVGQISGGKETNPAWKSEIGDKDFAEALSLSMAYSGVLAEGVAAPYRLDAKLVEVDSPFMGASLTVTTTVDYAVVHVASGAALAQTTPRTPYTAQFTDSLYGVERLRLAKEGSAKANIAAALDWLTQLPPQTFAAR